MKIQYLSVLAIVSLIGLGTLANRADASDVNVKVPNYIAGDKPNPCASSDKPNPCAAGDKPNPCASSDKPNPCASADKPNPCASKKRTLWGFHHDLNR
jgi:hypothetical protein